MKRLLSILLASAMLCAAVLFVHLGPTAAAPQHIDLKTADVSVYPTITLAGGNHSLYIDEHGPGQETVYDPALIGGIITDCIGPAALAFLKFDYDGVLEVAREGMYRIFGRMAMNEKGESINAGITSDEQTWEDGNIQSDRIYFSFDWRKSPVELAEDLHEFVAYVRQKRGDADRINFVATSYSGAVMLSYMKLYGYDDIASLVMNISMHNGAAVFGSLATGELALGAEALGKSEFDLSGLGVPMDLTPVLRALYELGLLDVLSMGMQAGMRPWMQRIYDEILTPLFFMIPGYWTYVPREDFAEAKAFLLKGDGKYAGLIEKIDRYHSQVAVNADEILLEADKKCKLAVRANYGRPILPIGKGAGVQGDNMVETFRASLGATCAPLDEPFPFFYKQKIDDDHNHISPDRYVDASTCLFPEQTWFTYQMPHELECEYSGWYDWWLGTDNPTVFADKDYPQFAEMVEFGVYVPRAVPETSQALDLLKAAVLWVMKAWRWLLQKLLFWMAWL